MTESVQQLQDNFEIALQKCSHLTSKEIFGLWAICATIIGNAAFSLSEVSRNFGKKIGRNFLSGVLEKYYNAQEDCLKALLVEICSKLKRNQKVYLLFDDTLVKKRGKKIFGSLKWFDHTIGRKIQSLCLLNLALVVDNQLVLIIPWLITTQPSKTKSKKKKAKEQDAKTKAALIMMDKIIGWLKSNGVATNRIVVEADSWFSSKLMLDGIREASPLFRIDGKKSYSVQIPDNKAKKDAKIRKRGRKRTNFKKYVSLEIYFGNPETWSKFTIKVSGVIVKYKTATLTLKTGGRVRVYAFLQEGMKNPKFILTNALKNRPPSAITVFRDYSYRWRIEEAHRDLKQQFGLGKCQNRKTKVVEGFIGLISFVYSIFKFWSFNCKQNNEKTLKCPTWANKFHNYQIKNVFEQFT